MTAAYPSTMTRDASPASTDSTTSTWSFASSSREPDFVLGPLALVAAGAFIRGVRQRKPRSFVVAAAAVALEFGWPAYGRLKRNPAMPTLLAYYPDTE